MIRRHCTIEYETSKMQNTQMRRVLEMFPFNNPYECQVNSMERILSILGRKEHLLFQSPTGTGKSLIVMCSVLSFVEEDPEQYQILLLTRTNGQINGLVKELSKIRDSSSLVSRYAILAGRSTFCLKKDHFRSYMLNNNIDPAQKKINKKYELFCTDCKKSLVKTSAKRNIDISRALDVSQPIKIIKNSPPKQETNFGNRVNDQNQRELACLHYGLSEIMREKEYEFKGYSKINVISQKSTVHSTIQQEKQDIQIDKRLSYDEQIDAFERREQQKEEEELAQYQINEEERLPDIEDMVNMFKENEGQCPFYFNRYIAKQARIVFMNYNYLLNPEILDYVSENVIDRNKKQIIIFDEAHNIEQQAESQFSTKLKMKNLKKTFDLISNIIFTLRLAKQLRLVTFFKEKGLELIEKLNDVSKLKKPTQIKNANSPPNVINLKTEEQDEPKESFQKEERENNNDYYFNNINPQLRIGKTIEEKILVDIDLEDKENISKISHDQQRKQRSLNYLESDQTQRLPLQVKQEYSELNCLKEKDMNRTNQNVDDYQKQCLPHLKNQITYNYEKKNNYLGESISLNQECEVKEEYNEINYQWEQEESLLIDSIRKERVEIGIIKIEDEEVISDIIEQGESNNNENDKKTNEKCENQKQIFSQYIDKFEEVLPPMKAYLEKLIEYCNKRSQKSARGESCLMSEYHFMKKYYELFGITIAEGVKQESQNEHNSQTQPNNNKNSQSILEEVEEGLKFDDNLKTDFEKMVDNFSGICEFTMLFHQNVRYLKVKYSKENQIQEIEKILGDSVYYEGNLYQMNISVRYFANNLQPVSDIDKLKKVSAFLSQLCGFTRLSSLQKRFGTEEKICQESPDLQKLQDFYFSVSQDKSNNNNNNTVMVNNNVVFTLGCLSGKYAFRQIFAKLNVHSLILSSGTLEPFDILAKNLEMKFQVHSANHVIDSEKQVFTRFIRECEKTKHPLNFSFGKMYMDHSQIETQKKQNIASTLQIMQRIVQAITSMRVHGGVLVFFKSYELMSQFYQAFLGSDAQRALHDIPIFYENTNNAQFQLDLQAFRKQIRTHKRTTLFFAACRGKLAEGIDLTDDLARCVILIGVPIWNISDPYFICKKKHVQLVLKMDPNEWARKQVIKCVNQAAGRTIRHRMDWGSIFFICEMFDDKYHPKNYKQFISKWVLLAENQSNDYISAFKSFLYTNSIQSSISTQ